MKPKRKGDKAKGSKKSSKTIEESGFQWDVHSEVYLFQLICRFRPMGPLKHWKMNLLRTQLSSSLGTSVSCDIIWAKLGTLFDLEEIEKLHFPKKIDIFQEFSLPKNFLASAKIIEVRPSPVKIPELPETTEPPSLSTTPPRKNKRKGNPKKNLAEFSPTITSDCEPVPIVIQLAPAKTTKLRKKPAAPSSPVVQASAKILTRRAKVLQNE
jgi:hypothetical protein